jgi:hypothetical protein
MHTTTKEQRVATKRLIQAMYAQNLTGFRNRPLFCASKPSTWLAS